MASTIKDVSKRANVSISTVSHVINGTRYVSDEVTQRVKDAIEEVGYVPNIIAKSLKQSATNTIGLVVSDIRNQFFVDIISVVDKEARKDGIQVFVSGTRDDLDREYDIVKKLLERRVDGIILSPTIGSEKSTIEYLKKAKMPTVMIDRRNGDGFDWVGSENHDSAKELVEYLYGHGHKRIAFVAGLKGISTNEERVKGFRDAIHKLGLEENEKWIITGNYRKEPVTEKVAGILQSKERPTAIVAGNNRMVLNIMKALQELGLDAEKDIELVAFDEGEWAEYFSPKITAFKQPTDEIGREAYRLLKNRIQDPDHSVQNITLKPKLVIRNWGKRRGG